MKNAINYYYNLKPDKINSMFDGYYFYLNSELYYLCVVDNNNINSIYDIDIKLLNKDVLVNEIILTTSKDVIIEVNNNFYILMKIFINLNAVARLSDISYLSNVKVNYNNDLMCSNWANLWASKIDYLEYYNSSNSNNYEILNSCFDYFVGLTENAISYVNQVVSMFKPEDIDYGCISHKKISYDNTMYSLYDPLNIIIDHKARDVAEYIKLSFFNDNFDIFDELDEYFKNNYFSIYGIHLILARILYPSFYFELYDDVFLNRRNEKDIINIIDRISEYEDYLKSVWYYFHKYYNVIDIEWITSKKEP